MESTARQPDRGDGTEDRRVSPDHLRWFCDPAELPFETTGQLPPQDGAIGQERGVAALEFGLEMESPGFNLFVAGPSGTGRTTTARTYAERRAAKRPIPDDWLYVYNFQHPDHPLSLRLPAGDGARFRDEMTELIKAVREQARRTFESRQYRSMREEIHRKLEERRRHLIEDLSQLAKNRGFAVTFTPMGAVIVPLAPGVDRPMTSEEVEHLPKEERERLRERGEELSPIISETLDQIRRLERETHAAIAEQDARVAGNAIAPLIRECQDKYRERPRVVKYLNWVQEDLIAHTEAIRAEIGAEMGAEMGDGDGDGDGEEPPKKSNVSLETIMADFDHEPIWDRYSVNVLVENPPETEGAPVIFEPNPTYYNLLGRIEYRALFGAMVTDFRMIKAGALHRANGGFLLLNAIDVFKNPFAWDALKRQLRTGQIRIENIGDQFTPAPMATLQPEPIPLNLKVLLIGPPLYYYLLYFMDEDFSHLFRVRADFDTEMARTDEHLARYAAFVRSQVEELGLLHFHRDAVAKVAEYGARCAEHQGKLSARLRQIGDLLAESSHWASVDHQPYVRAGHVVRAMRERIYRSNLIEEKIHELIAEGTILIDTIGEQEGQVNGLSVLDIGDYSFGRPVRITAQTSVGIEGVINLERETRLSGRIHSKGFLILTSFLSTRYAQDKPLALSARIAFEQTYDEVDGDSASSAELYALLSSLAGAPLRQDMAVTGSVNQLGVIQPVGGVNEKIEGFFDVCAARGLSGEQGVIIPAASLKNLMLREDVIDEVRHGRFHIWAVRTIDEGIEILTGAPAGRRRPDGTWEPETVNARVDQRLRDYAQRLRDFGRTVELAESRERKPAEIGPQAPRVRWWDAWRATIRRFWSWR
ncbi:MAG: AAA family ATPase [Chloracidobacterium sp.]|nr:AAA family ATPase [Chloracidobacterium sp.]